MRRKRSRWANERTALPLFGRGAVILFSALLTSFRQEGLTVIPALPLRMPEYDWTIPAPRLSVKALNGIGTLPEPLRPVMMLLSSTDCTRWRLMLACTRSRLSVELAKQLPEPDTSWMDEPWPRERFTGWTDG